MPKPEPKKWNHRKYEISWQALSKCKHQSYCPTFGTSFPRLLHEWSNIFITVAYMFKHPHSDSPQIQSKQKFLWPLRVCMHDVKGVQLRGIPLYIVWMDPNMAHTPPSLHLILRPFLIQPHLPTHSNHVADNHVYTTFISITKACQWKIFVE